MVLYPSVSSVTCTPTHVFACGLHAFRTRLVCCWQAEEERKAEARRKAEAEAQERAEKEAQQRAEEAESKRRQEEARRKREEAERAQAAEKQVRCNVGGIIVNALGLTQNRSRAAVLSISTQICPPA